MTAHQEGRAARDVVSVMVSKLDSAIIDALNQHIGAGWSMQDLAGRLRRISYQGQPQEIFTLDGVPIMEVWPPEVNSGQRDFLFYVTVTQNYRIFPPAK